MCAITAYCGSTQQVSTGTSYSNSRVFPFTMRRLGGSSKNFNEKLLTHLINTDTFTVMVK